LAKIISTSGGEQALVDYISETKGAARFPGISTLGFIAGFDEQMALGIITSKGIEPLKDALLNEKESNIREAAAWTLGKIGKHSG
jgi:HEAT repeat protein